MIPLSGIGYFPWVNKIIRNMPQSVAGFTIETLRGVIDLGKPNRHRAIQSATKAVAIPLKINFELSIRRPVMHGWMSLMTMYLSLH